MRRPIMSPDSRKIRRGATFREQLRFGPGRVYSQEYRTLAKGDTVRWLHEDVFVETLVEGRQWRLVSVCTDITAIRQAEKDLRDSQHRLQAIFDNALNAIVMTTHDRRFFDVNPAACILLGYERTELLTQTSIHDITEDRAGQILPAAGS